MVSIHRLLAQVCGLIGPPLFIIDMILLAIHPEQYSRPLFKLDKLLPARAPTLPLMPQTRSQAWTLGHIAGQLLSGLITEADALEKVASFMNMKVDSITVDQVRALGDFLTLHEQHKTPLSKVLGMWSFVNTMWVLSILGMTATIGPVIVILFGGFLASVVAWLKFAVIWLLVQLKPFYNLLAFYCCLCILSSAQRQPDTTAMYVALTGCMLAVPTMYLSVNQWLDGLGEHVSCHPRFMSLLLNLFNFLVCTIAAVQHSSVLLAFLATTALFGALGFSVTPTILGWYVGYDNNSQMYCGMTASTILITAMLALKSSGVPHEALRLFEPGVSIMGGNALGIAGLCLSSSYWGSNRHDSGAYLRTNTVFAASCLVLIAAASLYHVTPLRCTCTVYLVLWLSQKMVEYTPREYGIVVVFAASLAAWKLSFFLKAQPEYLMSLFNMF